MNGRSETTFIRKKDISSSDIGLGAFYEVKIEGNGETYC